MEQPWNIRSVHKIKQICRNCSWHIHTLLKSICNTRPKSTLHNVCILMNIVDDIDKDI